MRGFEWYASPTEGTAGGDVVSRRALEGRVRPDGCRGRPPTAPRGPRRSRRIVRPLRVSCKCDAPCARTSDAMRRAVQSAASRAPARWRDLLELAHSLHGTGEDARVRV